MGSVNDRGKAGHARTHVRPPQHGGHSRATWALVPEWLDSQRELLASSIVETGERLLDVAVQRLPDMVTQPVLEAGSRVLKGAASRLQEGSVEEWVDAVRRQVEARPMRSIVGLLGVGFLAGRLLRVVAAEAAGAEVTT